MKTTEGLHHPTLVSTRFELRVPPTLCHLLRSSLPPDFFPNCHHHPLLSSDHRHAFTSPLHSPTPSPLLRCYRRAGHLVTCQKASLNMSCLPGETTRKGAIARLPLPPPPTSFSLPFMLLHPTPVFSCTVIAFCT